jgi:hypothetical protein
VASAIAVASLLLSAVCLVATVWLWVQSCRRGWLDDVRFVSHLSLAALVFGALGMLFSALAALIAEG